MGCTLPRAPAVTILSEGREGQLQGSSSGCLAAQIQRHTESTRLPGPLAGVFSPAHTEADSLGAQKVYDRRRFPSTLLPSTGPRAVGMWSVRDRAASTAPCPRLLCAQNTPPTLGQREGTQGPETWERLLWGSGCWPRPPARAHPLCAHGHALTHSCSTQKGTRWDSAPQQDSGQRGPAGAPRWALLGSWHW